MLHLDTSFLAPLFKPEGRSSDVEQFIDAAASGRLAVSCWTQVEFSSLVAKEVRTGRMTPVQASGTVLAFDDFVRRTCTVIDVTRRDFDVACRFLADHRSGLRAGDALHLAVASNDAASGIYSLDRVMVAAGLALGLPMNPGFPAAT